MATDRDGGLSDGGRKAADAGPGAPGRRGLSGGPVNRVLLEPVDAAAARRAAQMRMIERRLRLMQARVAAVTSLADRTKRRP